MGVTMKSMTAGIRRRRSRGAFAVAVAVAATLAACADWLEVTNPGAIENPALEDPAYLQLMYDGVIGDFQPAYAWTALFGAGFADELRIHHAFGENQEIDQRRITENNATYALAVFNGLHRARFLADSVAGRYRNLLGDTVANDLRYAKILGFAGYTWVLLAENLCETRINAQGAPLRPDELFAAALQRFEAAMAAAQVAREAAEKIEDAALRAQTVAGADSALNMARVGAARAALGLGDAQGAITYARAVTPPYVSREDQGFRFDVHYREAARPRTRGGTATRSGSSWVEGSRPGSAFRGRASRT